MQLINGSTMPAQTLNHLQALHTKPQLTANHLCVRQANHSIAKITAKNRFFLYKVPVT